MTIQTTDFLIIGGGIAGASAGYYFTAHGKTIVLEQEHVPGYHSTGRSAALFRAYFGPELVCQLSRASYAFFANPPDGFTDVPLLTDRGLLFIGTESESRQAADILAQGKDRPSELRQVSAAESLELVPFLKPEFAQTGIHYPGAREMDVAALHQGWIRGLKKRGGEFLMKHPVTGIEHRNGTWIVTTKDETFEAGVLVNAAGGWADVVAQLAGLKPLGLIPKRRTIITIDIPPEHHNKHYPMVIYLDEKFYLKTEAGGLIASPMDATPVVPHDVQPEELEIATAAWHLEERTILPVPRIKSSWAGLRSFLPDEAPVAGRDPAADNFIWLAGQGGFGIKTCDALARCAVETALNNDIPADVKNEGIHREQLAAGRPFLKAAGPSV